MLKNFLSFDDEVQFDMFPNLKRTSLANHIYEQKTPVLKMAAIYGANGAGKSNLLKGLNFLRNFIINKDFVNQEEITKYSFQLKEDVGDAPIELTIEFINEKGNPYIYSLEIGKKGVEFETLLKSGLGKEENQILFTRRKNKVEYSSSVQLSDEIIEIVSSWIKEHPYSSLLTINKDMPVLKNSDIINARKWFENEMLVLGIHAFNPILIHNFKKDKKLNDFATNLFKKLDLGIETIKVKTEDFEDWITTHNLHTFKKDKINSMHNGMLSEVENDRNKRVFTVENGVQKVSQFLFKQYGENNFSKDMDIEAQSDGTVRLLSLIPAIYHAVTSNTTVIIDEIDHSIHPTLVRELIKYFSFNATKGQLIFTTHQTCLMNQDFIRTDEVWLVEKKFGKSYTYSLNDYKIHNTIKLENGYLDGRYGAIPFIGDLCI